MTVRFRTDAGGQQNSMLRNSSVWIAVGFRPAAGAMFVVAWIIAGAR